MNCVWGSKVHLLRAVNLRALACLFVLLCLPLSGPAAQTFDAIRLYDNSDWWSLNRGSESEDGIKAQERELAKPNFQILGVNLGEIIFTQAAAKLGKTTIIERGDASTGRRQACYSSRGNQNRVYLIFERDEVGYTFYLFGGGPAWEGSDLCAASNDVSRSLATGAGLLLGQTPAQVIAILGRPTKQSENELIYSFLVKKRTSSKDLKEARERNPNMSDKDFQENYGHYNLGAELDARFLQSKLTYLAVSKAESN
jgi:hypothetical protein